MNKKIIVGSSVLGIAGLIYAVVLFFTNKEGLYDIRILVTLGIVGLLFFIFYLGLATVQAIKAEVTVRAHSLLGISKNLPSLVR